MTREDIKTINDMVHKTIYGFFDCGDEETPMTDKDKLLLEVNKAVCNNIKDLEQEPCEDAISRQAALDAIITLWADKPFGNPALTEIKECVERVPSVTPKQRTGYISIDDAMSVFDDFMRGEVDEDETNTFLEMLKDKAGK